MTIDNFLNFKFNVFLYFFQSLLMYSKFKFFDFNLASNMATHDWKVVSSLLSVRMRAQAFHSSDPISLFHSLSTAVTSLHGFKLLSVFLLLDTITIRQSYSWILYRQSYSWILLKLMAYLRIALGASNGLTKNWANTSIVSLNLYSVEKK